MTDAPGDRWVYAFVRVDLPLADQMVQIGHACLEAGRTFAAPCHCPLVALQVSDQPALARAIRHCREHDIRLIAFVEPDSVDEGSDEPMGLTALCTEPLDADKRRRLRRFRLWTACADTRA